MTILQRKKIEQLSFPPANGANYLNDVIKNAVVVINDGNVVVIGEAILNAIKTLKEGGINISTDVNCFIVTQEEATFINRLRAIAQAQMGEPQLVDFFINYIIARRIQTNIDRKWLDVCSDDNDAMQALYKEEQDARAVVREFDQKLDLLAPKSRLSELARQHLESNGRPVTQTDGFGQAFTSMEGVDVIKDLYNSSITRVFIYRDKTGKMGRGHFKKSNTK